MENDSVKKIKLKNLKDVLIENLRIHNEKKLQSTSKTIESHASEQNINPEQNEPKKPPYKRISVSEEELDVMQLELKDLNAGKKSLKSIRKSLHKEIRDWVLSPFQRKQTDFNRKTFQNFTQAFTELDYSSKRIDANLKKIWDLQTKIDSTKNEIDQKLASSESKLEQKVVDIVDKKSKSVFSSNIALESSLRESYSKLLERNPDEVGFRFYLNKIKSDELDLADFEKILRNSPEYTYLEEGKKILKKIVLQIKKPIFIIGVPRTGTTLLHSILCAHDHLAWFSNQDIKNWISDLEHFQIYDYYKWLKSTKKKIPMNEEALLVFGKRLGSGLKQFGHPPKGTSKIPIEGEIFWRKHFGSEYVKDISIDKKIMLAKSLLETIENQSKTRFVCKAPNNSMRLFAIQKIFPDALFINIIRDPRAVVNSMLQRYKEEGKFQPDIQIKNKASYANLDLIEKFSTLYKEVTESIYEFMIKNSDNFLNIKYDDLIMDPVNEVNKVIKFCELEDRNPKKMMPPLRKKTNEKWKKNLTKEDEKRIFEIVEPALEKMNYPYKL